MHIEQNSFRTSLWKSFFSKRQALGAREGCLSTGLASMESSPWQTAHLHSQPGLGPLTPTSLSFCTYFCLPPG